MIFYVAYLISTLIFAFLFTAISYIPILNLIIKFLFSVADSAPDMVMVGISATSAAFVSWLAIDKISKNESNTKLSIKISSVILILINVLSMIVNIMHHDACYVNLVMIIVGILAFTSFKNE
jgi:hypothetical protein